MVPADFVSVNVPTPPSKRPAAELRTASEMASSPTATSFGRLPAKGAPVARQILEQHRLSDITFIVDEHSPPRALSNYHQGAFTNSFAPKTEASLIPSSLSTLTNTALSLHSARQQISSFINAVEGYQIKIKDLAAIRFIVSTKLYLLRGEERQVTRTMRDLLSLAPSGLNELQGELGLLESRIMNEEQSLSSQSTNLEKLAQWAQSITNRATALWRITHQSDTLKKVLKGDREFYDSARESLLLAYALMPETFPHIVAGVARSLFGRSDSAALQTMLSEVEKIDPSLARKVTKLMDSASSSKELKAASP